MASNTIWGMFTDLSTGLLQGGNLAESTKTVGDLRDYWGNPEAADAIASIPLYVTQTFFPHPDGTEGAVLWGNTVLYPGDVDGERFMTRGHWHVKRTHGELVITVSGEGLLLLMDGDGNQEEQPMFPGSTHHIDGKYAHRTVNTGEVPLVFLCAWPADCGHEYEAILTGGFTRRIKK